MNKDPSRTLEKGDVAESSDQPGRILRGVTLQLFLITILPLTALLLAITFGSLYLHQRAMRTLVSERDERAVLTAASALSSQVQGRIASVESLSLGVSSASREELGEILGESDHLLSDFEGGFAIYDQDGTLLSAVGGGRLWADLASQQDQIFLSWLQDPEHQNQITNAFSPPNSSEKLVAVVHRVAGSEVVLIGAFSPERLARDTLAQAFGTEHETSVIVVDASKQVLYGSGDLLSNGGALDHPGIAEALQGESGSLYKPVGNNEHVVAYSPVAPAGWALVIEEPWHLVESPLLSTTQIAPLVLVPVLLLTILALWFGVRQIVQPLQALEAQAGKLAWGDFAAIEKSVGGITEIRHLQTELVHLAHKVRAAQQSLHGYIGAITAGQEEERRRLARDLHDDTIQALIALKQRVQLAQLNGGDGARSDTLVELEGLTETTIDNLRRVTRALRPIYLEDLGLPAALEMLARETSQTAGFPVSFSSLGGERRLTEREELALYRIAQEALSNVTRHASAARASVRISYTPETVILEVEDDGQGFEVPKSPADFAPGGHFGLLGIHERAELLGARLEILSSPGKGTRLQVQL